MSCGAIGKQKYIDSTLLEPREAGTFVACSAGVFIGRARMVLIAKAPCCNSRREEEMGQVKGRGFLGGRKLVNRIATMKPPSLIL